MAKKNIYNNNGAGGVLGFLFVLALFGLAVYGYIMNIVELFHASSLSGMVVARAIGVFVGPLGAVLGYF